MFVATGGQVVRVDHASKLDSRMRGNDEDGGASSSLRMRESRHDATTDRDIVISANAGIQPCRNVDQEIVIPANAGIQP